MLNYPDRSETHLLDMVQAGRADDDRIAVLALHQAVVRDPAERDLRHRQVVRLRNLLDGRERVEIGLVPVPARAESASD